jgi:quercetin dioxygenase-like cupin family protein
MELIRASDISELSNSGVTSRQLLFPENSTSTRLTITRVRVAPGARNPPHRHPTSEQVWLALRGRGQLLLEGGETVLFSEGDVVRFEDGDLHGLLNTGDADLEYVSVTSPPVNFRAAYTKRWDGTATP